jgi:glucan phosphoethanolaminetransferase (alkaline phosphatase superfamily)
MPKVVNGLPVHALAVHAAVVAVPLAALLAVLFVIPRTRAWARWPLLIVSIGGLAAVYVAKVSGFNLEHNLQASGVLTNQNPAYALVITHSQRANQLWLIMIAFTLIVIAAFVFSRDPERFRGGIGTAVSVLLIIGAAAVAVQVVRVGDIGARAVWNPTGQTDYSST